MNFIGNRYSIINIEDNIEFNKLYKARDLYENKTILLKVINHNNHICEDFLANLIDESTIIREINSPYILNMIDVGVDYREDGIWYYMIYEYEKGISLNNIIEGNYLHLEAIISIATQILKGIEAAKEHGMYHGDLNPSNILVDKWYNVKILNFGVTKANHGVNIRSGNNIKYLSPHQLCINYTDTESDFFALGLILFECIFKKLPFGESYDEEQMLKFIDKGINFNALKGINGNEELIEIIKKLLNRTEKYSEFREVILDLSSIMYEKAEMHNEKGAWQMIFGVNTLPAYRRNGYAGELIRRAIHDAKQQGRKGLVLTCKEKLVSYYAKFGFLDEGVSEKSTHGNAEWHQMRLAFNNRKLQNK